MDVSSIVRPPPTAVIVAVVLCAAPNSLAAAQPRDVTLWAKGGLNLAKLGFEFERWQPGIAFGAGMTLDLVPEAAFQVELFYARKGAHEVLTSYVVDSDVGGVDTREDIGVGYLEVPVLLKLRPSGESRVSPVFVGGPALALKVSCGVYVRNRFYGPDFEFLNATEEQTGCTGNAPRDVVDAGLVVGAGLEFALGARRVLSLELRYDYGLLNLEGPNRFITPRNRVIAVLGGLGTRLTP